ncbi:MAG: Mrp/NBP35 family ATP-binding protein [Actinobacteria bacterium]|nr:Mrp/NBP35 family ATP-binding protein [Actinomycetota bacterium]MCB9413415.1 Mrp/NBP35 family ATP-binding protein [Actinomycetota bacterium]
MPQLTREPIDAALSTVQDPEIRRPITELGMVKSVEIDADGGVTVGVFLTVSSCPMQDTIIERVRTAVGNVPGVSDVRVDLDVMSDEQRKALREKLQGPTREIPFNRPGNTTRIIGISSGKGGVGKSSITVNLAVALAAKGLSVGILDADIYGHSVPRILGIDRFPTRVEGMLMPPSAHGVQAISMLMFKPGGVAQAVAYRGPMNHKLLQQFLTDVFWGDLDFLLIDLPPGTGDMAMSLGQLLPQSELLVVTTPQPAAADVAVRAGMMAQHTKQRVVGVVENMSAMACPHCGEPIDLFGTGGGSLVAQVLTKELGTEVPLIARVPFDVRLREGGDNGQPLVLAEPTAAASAAIGDLADRLSARPRGLAGMSLGLTPASRF